MDKLFRDTAAQETEHAFAHFRLLHPELVIDDPTTLSEYPEFAAQARADRDAGAEAEFEEQIDESKDHAGIFRKASFVPYREPELLAAA